MALVREWKIWYISDKSRTAYTLLNFLPLDISEYLEQMCVCVRLTDASQWTWGLGTPKKEED